MKNLLVFALCFGLTSVASAGRLKNLMIDADDVIMFEMYNRAHLKVESITQHKILSTKTGVEVVAVVATIHPENGYLKHWTCAVEFEKNGEKFTAKDINCF